MMVYYMRLKLLGNMYFQRKTSKAKSLNLHGAAVWIELCCSMALSLPAARAQVRIAALAAELLQLGVSGGLHLGSTKPWTSLESAWDRGDTF